MMVARPVSIPQSAFLLGVGGMGMAPLAIFLAQAGCAVSGWDDSLRDSMRALLESHGVRIEGAVPASVDTEALVFSSAIQPSHILLESSRVAGRTVMRRGEMLARLAADYKLLAVAGSHGKTTTTGMLIHFLKQSGTRFNYVLGARFRNDALPPAQYDAEADWLVAEVDESDGTIEGFNPEATVFVNFDWDHADRYANAGELDATFARLAQRTRRSVIVPADVNGRLDALCDAELVPVETQPDDFNRANAALAHAAAELIAGEELPGALDDFPGIARRQDVLYQDSDTVFVADYAHHPTEIAALLKHARATWQGRLVAVFQPHRYSRTAAFAKSFAEALSPADSVILLPVYAASESARADGHSAAISEFGDDQWRDIGPIELAPVLNEELAQPGESVVLFIGAGDIDRMAETFVDDWKVRAQLLEGASAETKLSLGEPLAKRTTLRVGGPARFLAEPADLDDLQALLKNARAAELPVFFLGRGSNLIVSDNGFDGLVIALTQPHWRAMAIWQENRIGAFAGVRLKELCGFAAKNGLSGLEFLEGIPGTVGGSLRMNAGAMGGWIFDVVKSVQFVTLDGELLNWPKEKFHIGYRNCAELRDAIAIKAIFVAGKSGESTDIRRQMDTYAAKRKESQPREPSAGCIFKNPEGNFAGKLVDELGLKGLTNGAAEVSAVHGNFIINRGGATSADVLGLVRQVRDTIHRERGIMLEPEVLLLGESWEEVLS